MVGIGKRPRTAVAPRRLYVALGAQAVIAAAAAASQLATGTQPGTGTGTRLTGYVDVALISLFIAAYGAATLLLGSHLAAVGHRHRVALALHVAGACMLAAAVENVLEDGFKVDRLAALWILLVSVSWLCLLFAGGTLMTLRGTRLLGLLLVAPPPTALVLDFAGWLPAASVAGVGIAVLVARGGDRHREVRQ
jgi:hypothetical protein